MSLPTLVGTAQWDTAGTALNVNKAQMPSGMLAGDLIVAAWCRGGGTTQGTTDTGAGWVDLVRDGANNMGVKAMYRVADGTESGALLTHGSFPSGTADQQAYTWVFRHWGSNPQAAAWALVTATNDPNPPSLTPSWGTDDCWLLTCAVGNAAGRTTSAFPTGYSGTDYGDAGGTTPHMAVAARAARVTTEDPGTYTISGATLATYAVTIAVRQHVPRHGFIHHNDPAIA